MDRYFEGLGSYLIYYKKMNLYIVEIIYFDNLCKEMFLANLRLIKKSSLLKEIIILIKIKISSIITSLSMKI